ncbi:MAG: Lytic transglycosylase catalytic [Thermoleophilia bacterium]|nr:Lytic transglycosylase catalytic [Thermoleophilia bacterium]
MHEFHPHTPRPRRFTPAALIAIALCALVGVPAAAATTLEFTPAEPKPSTQPIDLGLPPVKLGVQADEITFRTTAKDKAAQRAAKLQERLRDDAQAQREASILAQSRIDAIEELLATVEGDQDELAAQLQARAVQRYKGGEAGDLSFLLSGDGFSDLLTRNRLLREQASRDRRTIDEYEITVAKVEQYRQVLEDLRDITGQQAQRLEERAGRLDEVLVAAKVGHDEAPLEAEAAGRSAKPKGVAGTWYVMDGAFQAQLFLPNTGGQYDGGNRTAARPATAQQIQRTLGDPRIDLDASGYRDVLTNQIDGRLLDALWLAANKFNYVKVSSLKSDHGVYTASGNVSEHSFGCAADIGKIGKTYITPSAQVPGGEVEQAVLFFNGLGSVQPDLAPHQVISLFSLGGATLAMGDHGDHIHLGYSC